MNKADNTESEKRVNTIYAMRLQGIQRKNIIQYCAKKYGIKERQVDEYIKKAQEIISKEQEIEPEIRRSEILGQLYDLYNKNMKIEDYRECRNILNQISDILGVKAPVKNITELKGSKDIEEWLSK